MTNQLSELNPQKYLMIAYKIFIKCLASLIACLGLSMPVYAIILDDEPPKPKYRNKTRLELENSQVKKELQELKKLKQQLVENQVKRYDLDEERKKNRFLFK